VSVKEKHSHYYKNVAHLKDVDAYRVLERFGVTDPAIQHAVKKLLVAGGRGAGKDQFQDVQEAIDSLKRFTEMYYENAVEHRGVAYLVSHDDDIGYDVDLQKAFNQALQAIEVPMTATRTKKKAKKMPATVKKTLARRKAAKRAARRGR
jgi:hypothetical protein